MCGDRAKTEKRENYRSGEAGASATNPNFFDGRHSGKSRLKRYGERGGGHGEIDGPRRQRNRFDVDRCFC